MKNSELMSIAMKMVKDGGASDLVGDPRLMTMSTEELKMCHHYAQACAVLGVELFTKKIINEENKESIRNLKKGGIRA